MRTAIVLFVLGSLAWSETCDTTAIRWKLPHQFLEARKEAIATKRLLILKGIAFGVDKAGAQCATAGNW